MDDLHSQLRSETASVGIRIEELPFFVALQAGTLPKVAIVTFLRCLAIFHAVIERKLAQANSPNSWVKPVQAVPKSPLLAADLERLDSSMLPRITSVIQHALERANGSVQTSQDFSALIGPLSILEGSQKGGRRLLIAYAACTLRLVIT